MTDLSETAKTRQQSYELREDKSVRNLASYEEARAAAASITKTLKNTGLTDRFKIRIRKRYAGFHVLVSEKLAKPRFLNPKGKMQIVQPALVELVAEAPAN